jgi:hypothetical protein
MACASVQQGPRDAGHLEPAFTDVKQDGQLANIQSLNNFYTLAHEQESCELPNVSWIDPNQIVSEHPPGPCVRGPGIRNHTDQRDRAHPCWNSTAIFSRGTTGAGF